MARGDKKKGFTVIELIVVVIIVAILFSIAAPLMLKTTKARAISSEAATILGAIRQAERFYSLENPDFLANLQVNTIYPVTIIPDVRDEDVAGLYFSKDCYQLRTTSTPSGNIWILLCYPHLSTGVPGSAEVSKWRSPYPPIRALIGIRIDNGIIFSNMPELGYPSDIKTLTE